MSSRRERTLFIILACVIALIAGGYYYYLQRSVKPEVALKSDDATIRGEVPELTTQTVVDELSNVWDVGFLPDSTLLFTERGGTISKAENGQKVVLHRVANLYARGEGGLLGLTVDPDFDQNRYIYACYNTSEDIRVSRWKVNGETSALEEQNDIITGMPINTTTFPGRHSGCRPRFDGQGYLWVGTGDVAVGTNPQDPKSLGGKVLRVDRDGKPAPGNLGEPFDARVFNYGHRNVQGLALFDEPKGNLYGYSVEHGPDRDDEVNPLVPGNFGWNPVPEYNERVAMTDKEAYAEAEEALWLSGKSTIAPSGAVIIRGAKWKAYESQLAIAVLKDQHVRLIAFDAVGRKVVEERQLFKSEYGRIRSVVMGPDDDLFLTTDNGRAFDKIIRVSPH